jgi:hypothetical protein
VRPLCSAAALCACAKLSSAASSLSSSSCTGRHARTENAQAGAELLGSAWNSWDGALSRQWKATGSVKKGCMTGSFQICADL